MQWAGVDCALWKLAGVGRLLPACTTPVQDGMSVSTQFPRLTQVSLHHAGVSPFRTQSSMRHLRLQRPLRVAGYGVQRLGVTHVRFPYSFPSLAVDASLERYVLDHNRCILCTRCVRVCAEVEGARSSTSADRGSPLHARLRSEPAVGARRQVARVAANACRSAPPGRWRRKASGWKKW